MALLERGLTMNKTTIHATDQVWPNIAPPSEAWITDRTKLDPDKPAFIGESCVKAK